MGRGKQEISGGFCECDVAIEQGVTLDIEPGVIVQIDTMRRIIVDT